MNKIERLKDELRASDYIALKYAEGIDCSEYGNWKEYRQELRNEINKFIDMSDDEYNELYKEVADENTTDTTDISNEVDTEETRAENANAGTLE